MKPLIENIKKKEENFTMNKKLNLNDYMNKKYGCLTIIGIAKPNTNVRLSRVRVKCDCGIESDKLLSVVLKSLHSCSRKCSFYWEDHTAKTVEKYIGKEFGYLKIASYVGRKDSPLSSGSIYHRPIVRCECKCGQTIDTYLYSVTQGYVMSCGKCNLVRCNHKETVDEDPIGIRLMSIYHYAANRSKSIEEDQLSKEWFNKDDPIPAIHRFMSYCRPLYEKCMSDNDDRHIYIHRIDIDKLLGPGNVYFDHNRFNINYHGRVFY